MELQAATVPESALTKDKIGSGNTSILWPVPRDHVTFLSQRVCFVGCSKWRRLYNAGLSSENVIDV